MSPNDLPAATELFSGVEQSYKNGRRWQFVRRSIRRNRVLKESSGLIHHFLDWHTS
jgi:hypothetical protein